MRPKKQINPNADRSGFAGGEKGRHYTTGLPTAEDADPSELPTPRESIPDSPQPLRAEKYVGRASVGPHVQDADPPVVIDLTAPQEWIDPLDDDDFALSTVAIDLRSTIRDDPSETYFQRYSSRVPGHE